MIWFISFLITELLRLSIILFPFFFKGKDCKYRHALPPGYVLVTKGQKKEEENVETITLEEFLETEVSVVHIMLDIYIIICDSLILF